MSKYQKKYKVEDGHLIPLKQAIKFGKYLMTNRPQGIDDTKEIYNILSKCKCEDIVMLEDEDGNDTVYFEVTDKTKMSDLLEKVGNLRPDEIRQVTKNCFRIWWD